jgi:5,10-methylenetetrahydrofolate reductase
MAAIPCPFATSGETVAWGGTDRPGRPAHAPTVLTDLTVRPYDAANVTEVCRVLADSCDGLLVGEHQGRADFPPVVMAELIRDAGGAPWITLSCRDRNRVVLEQELAGLAHVGVAGVLCVTGDGRAPGVRPDVTQVFDIDGTRLAALAAQAGLTVAVPEAPDAPPVALRPARLREKQRAGAQIGVLNHVGTAQRVAAFTAAAAAAGVTLPLIAGVAVYTDERSAAVLQRFPGLELDADRVAAVLRAPDPVAAGIEAAVAEARELLAVPGVVGVNLSGLASGRGEVFAAEVKAAIGREIR